VGEPFPGGHRLPAGSIELGSCLTKREAILPEDHSYEDPQLEPLRLAHAASLQAASHDGLRPQVCPRVHSQAERLASGGERTSTRLSLKTVFEPELTFRVIHLAFFSTLRRYGIFSANVHLLNNE
jgi:hypothetical protein